MLYTIEQVQEKEAFMKTNLRWYMNEKSNMRQVVIRPRPRSCEMSHNHVHWLCDQKKRKLLSPKYMLWWSLSPSIGNVGNWGWNYNTTCILKDTDELIEFIIDSRELSVWHIAETIQLFFIHQVETDQYCYDLIHFILLYAFLFIFYYGLIPFLHTITPK